jgi:DNA-binding GntR family transcriptional regulator
METHQLSLAEEAYRVIRRDIIWCILAPGTAVTRGQLAARYNAGQAAVREALSRLSQEQLVQVMPREGYSIAPITLKQVQDVLDARLVIEPAVSRLAAGHVDSVHLRQLKQQCQTPHRLEDRETLRQFVEANTAFHTAVAQATRNERLVAIVASLLERMERFMYACYLLRERNDPIDSEHDPLVEALIAGNEGRAEQLMREDVLFAREFVLAALLASKALQSVNLFERADPAIKALEPGR